jgi:hypothetical protein
MGAVRCLQTGMVHEIWDYCSKQFTWDSANRVMLAELLATELSIVADEQHDRPAFSPTIRRRRSLHIQYRQQEANLTSKVLQWRVSTVALLGQMQDGCHLTHGV